MKGMIGSGILTLPIVFQQAGLWTGFILVFLFGFLNTLTMTLLVRSAHHLARQKSFDEKNVKNIEGVHKEENSSNETENGEIFKKKKCINDNDPMNYGEVMEAALGKSGFEWSQKWARPAKLELILNN